MNKWDKRFLDLASHVATWSKDPSTKVGAVIVRPNNIRISDGYNGFPRGVKDYPSRYIDRETKLSMVVHAEANAILTAQTDVHGCTIYVSPFPPCSHCAGLIIQAGITRVVSYQPGEESKWKKSWETSQTMFEEAGVTLTLYKKDEENAS